MIRLALALLLCLSAPALAAPEAIVAGLSQNRVSITADFDGTEILIYGAVKRDAPAPQGPMEVIVTVEGPATTLTIRKKERRAGIWINTEAVHIDAAPSFYAVATTGPLDRILSDTEDLRYRVSPARAIRAIGLTSEAADPAGFVDALMRIRFDEDRFRLQQGTVEFVEDTLFRADVLLPANLTEGEYKVRIMLTRDGKVIDSQERVVGVRKEGLERFLNNLAHQMPLLYGLLSLALAGLAGWGASAAFTMLRR
ncbi:TIGR02186 family protein [Paragemmobacter straminiformis]|uniref:TIGR02186 family protein n=1 Tax=Paragemmobacter straminiformis TaxID=2045119 RepID=A0A842I9T2_9RHOB|nr:TIGR02186 family protein [Gemmobacter straminiformis]MBC2836351.1 TIGR02186 family protein [Gemmobacter straminiformis]